LNLESEILNHPRRECAECLHWTRDSMGVCLGRCHHPSLDDKNELRFSFQKACGRFDGAFDIDD